MQQEIAVYLFRRGIFPMQFVHDDIADRSFHNFRSVFPKGMPVQSADSLQKQVHWANVRNQQIKVNVQRLLQDLCPDHNGSAANLCTAVFPHSFQKSLLF